MSSFDLTRFSMSSMAVCGAALRKMGEGAGSMEEAAERSVEYLYESLTGPAGERAFALVRLFKTHPYQFLDGGLQAFARQLAGMEPPPRMKCLTLLATRGDRPEWCTRAGSAGHQAIPLASVEGVGRIPMIANLIQQFGVEISEVLSPPPPMLADLSQRTFNVFHVAEALGSAAVPAQEQFVAPEKIHSCLGFGGMLPDGDLFAVVMFSRIAIPAATASMFKPLSLSVKTALLPFAGRVFGSRAHAS